MVDFVRSAHRSKLDNYSGTNIVHILRLLYADHDDQEPRGSLSDVNNTRRRPDSGAERPTNTELKPADDQRSTHNLAHGLHYASIAMLGVLVLEVSSADSLS